MTDNVYFKETTVNRNYNETKVNENNESKRLPVMFCLDISPSMNNHDRIIQLNNALNKFIEELQSDMRTKNAAEIAIVTFGSVAEVRLDFQECSKMAKQQIKAIEIGHTLMGTGIMLALDIIEKRRKKYIKAGFTYYLPYLIVITDGKPEFEDTSIISQAINAVYKASTSDNNNEVILTFPIGVGKDVTVEYLKRLSDGFLNEPIIFEDSTEFSPLFKLISASISNCINGQQTGEAQKEDIKNAWQQKLKNARQK